MRQDNTSFSPEFRSEFLHLSGRLPEAPRLRLAPTPSGFLHAGNAFNFVLNALLARARPGGRLLLRIDDLDADRTRPEYVQDVFDTLQWLGISPDEGPSDIVDFEKNWSQHVRISLYEQAQARLRETGLLFACAKSRRALVPHGNTYPPEFRDQGLSLDTPHAAWRIQTPAGFPMPDFIVRRRDGIPAYQLASLVDDLHFGITHVVRGEDLADSTRAQQFLAACLGEDRFAKIHFLHHPLLVDESGEKLSKSAGATALRSLREQSEGPETIYKAVASMLGSRKEDVFSFEGLLKAIYL
jgi:glutamyl/glutaminyl-tRNA synthetase